MSLSINFESIGLWGSFAGGLHINIWDPGDVLVKILAWSGSDGLTDGSTISSPLIDGKRFPVPATSCTCKQNKFSPDWWKLIQRDLCYMVDFPPAPVRGSRNWRPTWNGETESASRRKIMENNVRIKKVGGKTKSVLKTKLNFYFVPDRTG